ncbi:LOW QUALITY PROTEIN: regucalcin [Nilaparvata lugens]|uniref:LOW QUALITY PROTEIN: regucalcin n=1 Tax=Nilaparvata lugens TaxID=108931 RepID=UPI00193D7F88|nr:LOW QUALITY PROTEIN: regucalcin [Nilaparvata lugens]
MLSLRLVMTTMYKVEKISKPLTLGEGPHWDVETQCLYYVDIKSGSIHCYNRELNKNYSAVVGEGKKPVSLIIPVEGQSNRYMISVKNDVALVTWDGASTDVTDLEVIASLEPADNTNRLNDGKADPKGRLWAGTMGRQIIDEVTQEKTYELEKGSLYLLYKDKTVKKQLTKLGIANGLAWTVDKKKMYYIDSMKKRVDSYDYDDDTGNLSNEKVVFDFTKNEIPGFPDGMTMDAEGKLYVANYGGSQVLKIDPESGDLLDKIVIPALNVTSVAFGGTNLDELYVTTASADKPTVEGEENDGCLFRVTSINAKGLPAHNIII